MHNHYVPKYYLSGFTDPRQTGRIYRYQKRKTEVLESHLSKVAQEKGFYSDNTEAFLAEEIEKPANKVLAKLRGGVEINHEDRLVLSKYMVVFIKRVPKGLERARKWFDENEALYFEKLESEIAGLIREHPEKAELLQSRLAEVRQLRTSRRITPKSIWQLNLAPQWMPSVLEALSKMAWRFYTTKEPNVFITSDNPVFIFESVGVGNPQSEVSFPISATLSLQATWRNSSLLGVVNASRQVVNEFNRRQIVGASKYIFSSRLDHVFTELVNKDLRLNWVI